MKKQKATVLYERLSFVREYVRLNFVDKGMCADIASSGQGSCLVRSETYKFQTSNPAYWVLSTISLTAV